MRYAKQTQVSVGRTRTAIDDLLSREGASRIAIGTETTPPRAVVAFTLGSRHVLFRLPLPTENDAVSAFPRARDITKARESLERQRWRALLLALKAKFVAVESGVESFDQAFLAHLALPGGRVVGDDVLPALAEGYRPAKALPALLGLGDR